MEDQSYLAVENWTIEPVDEVVYELFLRGRGSKPEARAECGLTETEFRSRVERLLARRLLRRQSCGDSEEIHAIPPRFASAEITAALQLQAQRISQDTAAVRKEFSGLESLYRTVSQDGLTGTTCELLLDTGHLSERLRKLFMQAESSLSVVHPLLGPDDLLRALGYPGGPSQGRGVSCQLVFRQSLLRQPKALDDMRVLLAMGVEIRTVPIIPVSVILLDRETVVVPLGLQGEARELLLCEHKVAHFAQQVFEHVWDSAVPFTGSSECTKEFDDLELAILSSLGAGYTDEVTARQLGISTRTLRRYLAGISERLGVETRFQLGVAAAWAGLLEQKDDPSDFPSELSRS
jgi:DNA-binding CsgD family transcriptional regulator